MGWRPKSLLESDRKSLKQDRAGRFECPTCKAFRHAAVIIDVRHLPIPEGFACDVCWTHWERTGRIIDGGPAISGTNKFEWRRRWVIAHNAPQAIVDKFKKA